MNLSSFSLAALFIAVLTSVSFAQTPGSVVSVAASYTASPTNRLIIVNAASNATITLAAGAIAGQEVTVVQNGTAPNTLTIVSPGTLVDPNGLAYMGGTACGTGESVHLIADGAGTWYVLDGNNNNCSNNSANAPAGAQTKVAKGAVDGQTLYWDNTAKLWKVSSRLLQPTGATTIRYVDGNQAANKVLTSDASGNATWQTPGGGGGAAGTLYSKAADEARTATGVSADAHLTGMTLVPNSKYYFEGYLIFDMPDAGTDVDLMFHASGNCPTNVDVRWVEADLTTGSGAMALTTGNNSTTYFLNANTGDRVMAVVHGTIENSSGASKALELQWANHAGTSTLTLRKGSFFRLVQM